MRVLGERRGCAPFCYNRRLLWGFALPMSRSYSSWLARIWIALSVAARSGQKPNLLAHNTENKLNAFSPHRPAMTDKSGVSIGLISTPLLVTTGAMPSDRSANMTLRTLFGLIFWDLYT